MSVYSPMPVESLPEKQNALHGISLLESSRARIGRLAAATTLVISSALAGLMAETATEPTAAAADTLGYPDANMPCEHAPYNVTGNCTNYDWGPKHTEAYDDPSEYSSRGYSYRNCTDYTAWRLESVGIPDSQVRGLGNGGQWYANAPASERSLTPRAWDAAVAPGNPGHVAFVDSVNNDGTITISEYNYAGTGMGDSRTGTPQALGFSEFVDFGLHPQTSGGSANRRADDFIIYRPGSDGNWYAKAGPSGATYVSYDIAHGGHPGDVPLLGDFNHDGKDDFVIYRSGQWYVKNGPDGSNFIGPGPNGLSHGGHDGDIPLVGDIDGNGIDDYIIYRPSDGHWYTKSGPDGSAYISDVAHGGHPGDIPLVGDFNGDGKDDFVIYRNGQWFVKAGPSGTSFIAYGVNHGGHPDDIPLVGDFNGDGIDDYVIYRASEGKWYVKAGPDGTRFIGAGPNGLSHGGKPGDIPLVGDIDGNGIDDYIIYRPSEGRWYTKSGPDGSAYISDVTHGGLSGDVPLVGNVG